MGDLIVGEGEAHDEIVVIRRRAPLVDVVAGEPADVVVVVSEAEGDQFAKPVVELAGEE